MELSKQLTQTLGQTLKKPTRSISGITPLTVVLPPKKCWHGTCTYCPGGEFAPQSYTPESPAVMRASALNYDPYKQVQVRLEALKAMGHPTDKIELIFIGGTFMQYNLHFRDNFVKRCYDALNESGYENKESSRDYFEAQKINETAKNRCVAFCIENRPDNCSVYQLKKMREYGATRIEIGVQLPDDEVYKLTNRGHTVQHVIEATEALKNAGFKVGYHFMPGLPGSDIEKDIKLFKMLFNDSRFKSDQLKIYPCQVMEGTDLEKEYWEGKFKPYTSKQIDYVLRELLRNVPRYCRVMRMMREFPAEYLIAGTTHLDARKDVETELRESGEKLQEIRFREIGFNKRSEGEVNLKVTEYDASNGKEFFLEFVNESDVLFGLLRLRFPSSEVKEKGKQELFDIMPELKDCALIREIHVYGKALELNEEGREESGQHIGLGKKLMAKAEEITKQNGHKKIAVISGIGVREYYKKLGYKLEGTYMVKEL